MRRLSITVAVAIAALALPPIRRRSRCRRPFARALLLADDSRRVGRRPSSSCRRATPGVTSLRVLAEACAAPEDDAVTSIPPETDRVPAAASSSAAAAAAAAAAANGPGKRKVRSDASFRRRLSELIAYRSKHGHCNVPVRSGALGGWVQRIRRERNNGSRTTLCPERERSLTEVGFVWDVKAHAFEVRCRLLALHRDGEGRVRVPRREETLYKWCRRVRVEYRALKSGNETWLTEEQASRLSDMGFDWEEEGRRRGRDDDDDEGATASSPRNRRRKNPSFEERMDALRAYRDENGHCAVPSSCGPLGSWARSQRRELVKRRRGEKSKLTDEALKAMEDVGFVWDVKEWKWGTRLDQLRRYRDAHGNCDVPTGGRRRSRDVEGNFNGGDADVDLSGLSRWIGTQRTQYRLKRRGEPNHLTDDREAALTSLGFRWDIHDCSWFEKLALMREYKDRHGHCNVPQNHGALGSWVGTQRTEYRYKQKGEHTHLTEEREKILIDMGFEFAPEAGRGNRK